MDEDIPVDTTRFEQQDRSPLIFAQPIGQNTTGRTGTDDDVILGIHSDLLLTRQINRRQMLAANIVRAFLADHDGRGIGVG